MVPTIRILYVTEALRSPPQTGCVIRTLNMCRLLQQCGIVTCAAVENYYNDQSVEEIRKVSHAFEPFFVSDYTKLPRGISGFVKKLHMHWPGPMGFHVSSSDRRRFQELADRHDLVWFHTPAAAVPFGAFTAKRSVMDLDDLNADKFLLRAQQDKTFRLRLSARVQGYKWRRIESDASRRYSAVVVCSRQDQACLGHPDRVHVIPNGFAAPGSRPVWRNASQRRLGFIGTLTYAANQEGLIWFRDRVWPLIRQKNPDIRFRIIGALPKDSRFLEAEGFEPLGFVEDPSAEFATWSAMAVPMTFGGGTRIKILEAFSRMCPVVSTPVGAYGIDATPTEHLLIAENPDAFADACRWLCENPDAGRQLAENAWNLFVENYSWERIGRRVGHAVQSVMGLEGGRF